ncbi:hypothetical protein ACFWVM_14800 [Nocardia fluminea]|uniref:hypothetical protein n=1 Tax=Nocardia fluminea TaxID=134984 RepID=UPI00364698F9
MPRRCGRLQDLLYRFPAQSSNIVGTQHFLQFRQTPSTLLAERADHLTHIILADLHRWTQTADQPGAQSAPITLPTLLDEALAALSIEIDEYGPDSDILIAHDLNSTCAIAC